MRILTVSNCPLVATQGSGSVILGFAERLRERGHTVELYGPPDYEVLGRLTRAKSYRQAAGMLALVTRRLARSRYDVVEFYGAESWLALSALRRLPRRDFLLVSHSNGLESHYIGALLRALGTWSPNGSPTRWYQRDPRPLFDLGFRSADGIVTVSEFDRDFALTHGYQPSSRVVAVPNAVDPVFLDATPRGNSSNTVGFCGSWISIKGIDVMTRDVTEFLRVRPDWRFSVVGVGDGFRAEDVFPADVRARVDVVPYLRERRQLRDWYGSVSILVAPSIYESFSLAVAEGMCCGCAVVATRIGVAASLVDGEQVVHLPASESPHLYEALIRLADDEALRNKLARAGREYARRLTWDAAVQRLESTYVHWLDELRAGHARGAA
ncbi:MAG: glycosyltransferase family 4 protein [Myxococcota bacterium]